MKSLDRYLEECCLKFKDNVAVVENQNHLPILNWVRALKKWLAVCNIQEFVAKIMW